MYGSWMFFAVLIFRSISADVQTPLFRIRIFSDLLNIVSLLQILGCVFDASLMPILCSGRPPTISQIKATTSIQRGDLLWRNRWGVYIVVLEKHGFRPILYVGSSMNVQDGIYGRSCDYRSSNNRNLPRYVLRAIKKGYKITNFSVPFFFTKPTNPVLLGFAQTLVLAVEHTLTFRLWTMIGTWNNCKGLALWKKEDQEYDGANSHSCMHESRSLEEIKPEEIAELLEERAKRNKAKHDIYRATHKKQIRATQKIWDEENKEHRKEGKRQWNEENKEHINEYARKRAKTAKETAQFPCNDCGLNFANKKELKRHKDSEIACKPKRDAARSARLTCGGCQREFAQMANLERHIAQGTCRTVQEMSCPTCGRVIKSKSNLERHMATHK
ncbi:hypothetical protein CC77DRAFT_261403 [Alternaria alternata]|uniref:C2H2-type domain-containing protein n=1 Tax=Alternaria alternata TaxID=5599 RepID=A0A177DFD8_ALTAL|nr:hypothetical protein CC77DRAFT_261403 [Alternaria alternata]OAG17539.1 hypothetical protein CC77DRAFT_261403 [Alternaria alternata]